MTVTTIRSFQRQFTLLMLAFFSTLVFSQQDQDEMQETLEKVEKLYLMKPDEALDLTLELNKQYPRQHQPKVWLARLYAQFSDYEKAFNYAKQASEYELTKEETAYVEMAIGYFYTFKQQKESAIRHLSLAVDAALASGDTELHVEMLSIKADMMISYSNVEQAMQDMALAYGKIDQVSKPQVLASLYNSMCSIYIETGHSDKAIEAMLKSVEYVKQMDNAQQLSVVYFNLADLFIKTKQFDEALAAYQNSELFSLRSNDEIGVGYAKMGIGNASLSLQQPEKAIEALVIAEATFIPQQHTRNLIRIYADLAKAHLQLEQFDSVRANLEKLDSYSNYNNIDNRRIFLDAKQTLSQLYFALGDYRLAFEQQSMYVGALNDLHQVELEEIDKSVFARLSDTIIARENQVLKLENRLKENELDKQKRQSSFLLTVAIFSIIVTVFVTALLRKNSKLSEQLDKLATTDELTKLFNRRKIMHLLSERFNAFKQDQEPLYLALFDLDCFKKVNDIYGHVVGDKVLQDVARCAVATLGKEQDIGRYGGEEFLVVMSVDSYKQAHQKLELFREAVAKLKIEGLDIQITVSIGLSEAVEQDQFQTDVIHRVDKALYAAKKAGRNRLLGQ